MARYCKNALLVCAGALIIAAFSFSVTDCKKVSSSVPRNSPNTANIQSNSKIFYSIAKSLATEAMSQLQETSRRNPRLGFNITLPPAQGATNSTDTKTVNVITLFDTLTKLGVVGFKGGMMGIKGAIIQAIVTLLFIIFLLAGIAYFACNIGLINCSNVGGSLANFGGGLEGFDPFARSGYNYHYHHPNLHRATSAVYNAIDDGQKKYT